MAEKKKIEHEGSYRLGVQAGLKNALVMQIDAQFDYAKRVYANAVWDIHDENIIKELSKDPGMYALYRNKENFESVLRLIERAEEKYRKVKEQEEKEAKAEQEEEVVQGEEKGENESEA